MALRIGLTGGTGSGKSSLARAWSAAGAMVIDADALAREVVEPGTPGLAAIVEHFGADLLDGDGRLRRAELAAIVFADRAQLRVLESITHPLIEQRTAELMAAAPTDGIVVHDIPLIVERGTAARYHLVVVVDAPEEIRVHRLVGRGMAADDARRRIAEQASTAERRAVADIWVDNSGDEQTLQRMAQALFAERLQPYAQNWAAGRPAVPDETPVPYDPTWPAQASRLIARLEFAG